MTDTDGHGRLRCRWAVAGRHAPLGQDVPRTVGERDRAFHFHALEKAMATHSSVLAWRIPRDGGASWAAVYGVAQSRTRPKRLSSSSSVLSSPITFLSFKTLSVFSISIASLLFLSKVDTFIFGLQELLC